MLAKSALVVVIATVLAVHLLFSPWTYHAGEVKVFAFLAGLAALAAVATGPGTLARLGEAFASLATRHIFGAVAAFALLSALSIAWARYPDAAAFRAAEVALYASWMLLVVLALRTRRDVSRVIDAFLLAGVLSAAAAFLLWSAFPSGDGKFDLPMSNQNWLAVAMLIPMMLCVEGLCRNVVNVAQAPSPVIGVAHPPSGVSSADDKKQPQPGAAALHKQESHPWAGVPHKLRAALFAAAFALMAAAVWMADSQSSAVAFAAALVLLPILAGARRKWLLSAALAGVILLACVVDLSLGERSRVRAFGRSKSVAIRLDLWRWGTTLAERNPVSGLGGGGFFPNVGEAAAADLDARPGYYADIEQHAHNELLEILVELGVFGVAAFAWPVLAGLWFVARLPRDDPGDPLRGRLGAFAAGWLAVLLQSLLDVGMRFESVPVTWWTALAVLAASLLILREKAPAPASEPERVPWRGVAVRGAVAMLVAAWLIATGWRGAVAMREAQRETDPGTRIALLRTAASNTLFFVDRVRARNELGVRLAQSHSPRAASDEFREVLRLAGHYHDTELLLASTLLDQDRDEEAMAALARYGELRPADARTVKVLVDWLSKRPADEAIRRVNALGKTHANCSKLYVAAGLLALKFDPPDEAGARQNFELALKLNSRDAHARFLLGMARLRQGRTGDGFRLLEDAYARGFRSDELYVNLARMRRAMDETENVRALLEEGARMFPESKEIRAEIASHPSEGLGTGEKREE